MRNKTRSRKQVSVLGLCASLALSVLFLLPGSIPTAVAQAPEDALLDALAESRAFQVDRLEALNGSERRKIDKGDVVAILEEIPGSPVKIGRGIGVIPIPPEIVWQVLNDYGSYKDFMPFTKEYTVDEERSGGEVVYTYSEIAIPLIEDRYFTLKITNEGNVDGQLRTFFISWTLDPGTESNLFLNSGSWKLVPYGEGGQETLAFYTVLTDPGGSIPNFIKNKSTAIGIPSVYEAINDRAVEGLKARIYESPPAANRLDTAMRRNLEASRQLGHAWLEDLSETDRETLDNGVALVTLSDIEGTWLKIASSAAILDMPTTRVYEILTRYNEYQDYMPYIVESRVDAERSKGNVTYLFQRLHFLVFPYIKDRYLTVELIDEENPDDEAGAYFLSWWLDPASPTNINRHCGSWKLVPCGYDGSKTLVFYTVLGDPGGLSPWFWKNLSAKKAVRNVFEAIRERAGDSG